MSNRISSCAAVLASASLLVAVSGFAQPSGQNFNEGFTPNFYVTTPQTGETKPARIETPSQPHRHSERNSQSTARTANTYLAETSWNQPVATRTVIPQRQRQKSSDNSKSKSRRGYTIQQVSNPAASQSTAQATANLYSQTQNSRNNYYTSRQGQSVAASAQVQANYYQRQPTQRTTTNQAYVSNASSGSNNNSGFLSGLFHRHSHATATAPARQQQTQARPSVATRLRYRASKLNGRIQDGRASWYGKDFDGGKTANGETYDMDSMTAAHKTLPFGTIVRVRNERNGRECVVRINNRGPFIKGRILDLSRAAARKLDMVGAGVAKIRMEVIGRS